MSSFLTGMPLRTGNYERDLQELYTWACKLIVELRSLLYSLDAQNVKEARSVLASRISGVLRESQIPTMTTIKVSDGADNGIRFVNSNSDVLASIYYDGDNKKLVFDSTEAIYLDSNGAVRVNGDDGVTEA